MVCLPAPKVIGDDAKSGQVTIDETELNAELTSTKKDLETANKNNKTLEETIKSLREKLKAYEENTVVSDGKKKVK